MTRLLIYNPIYFTGLEHLEDFNTWRGMYRVTNAVTAPYIDRTEVVKFPIKTHIPDSWKMPGYDPNFKLTYTECAVDRAEEIFCSSEKLGIPIYVFWSGGIDSSMVLTAFIMARGLDYAKKKIKVVMTPEGIVENPFMYYDWILPHLEIVSGEHIDSLWGKDKIIVTGELNDQIIGSDVMRDFITFKGKKSFTEWSESEITRYYMWKGMPEIHAEKWSNVLSTVVRSAPCPVYDYWDYYWYITFTCKWMYVSHRLFVYANPNIKLSYDDFEIYHQAFYSSEKFQQWAMNNPDKKHQESWDTHKWYPRQLVAEFMKRPEYLKKNKNGSLWKLAISKKRANAVDQNLNMYDDISINDWYESNNSFKDTI